MIFFTFSQSQLNDWFFCPAMRCKNVAYVVMRCLSVRPSVTFVDHVKTNKDIFEIFSPPGSDAILAGFVIIAITVQVHAVIITTSFTVNHADDRWVHSWCLRAAAIGARRDTSGPVAYGLCQAACSAAALSCYVSAGLTFGTVTAGVVVPAAAIACNVAFAKCSAASASFLLLSIP